MRFLNQVVAVTVLNIRNLPKRLGTSMVAIVGVAAVVVVFAGVLSMANGFERTLMASGAEDSAIIMRSGATSELSSGVGAAQVDIINTAPGVLRDGDTALVSAELYVVVDVKKKATNEDANVPFRGVEVGAFDVRRNVELTEGRMFTPGTNEFVVGRAAQEEFVGLGLNETVRFGQTEWTVVGVFEAGGSVSESELWTDVRVLQSAYRRGNSFQSVRVRLESADSLEILDQYLTDDPRINVDVVSERDYYASQAEGTTGLIRTLGYPVMILMSIGAVFGALNSMYSSISVRGQEIATLRAIGFGPFAVLISTVVESTLLALIGGLVGAAAAFLVFNGFQASTLGASFSQVVFDFAVTPDLLLQGMQVALIIGLVGGLFPAIRAARLPVAQALREL